MGQGRGLLNPPWPSSFSVLGFAALLPVVCPETIRSARYPRVCTRFVPPVTHEQERLFQPRPVAGQHLVEARLDGSSATVSPVQNPEQISGGRVTTTLHTMQDHLQQTTVMTQRRSSKMRSEHTVSKTKGESGLRGPHRSARTPGRCEVHLRPKVQPEGRGRDELHKCHTRRPSNIFECLRSM